MEEIRGHLADFLRFDGPDPFLDFVDSPDPTESQNLLADPNHVVLGILEMQIKLTNEVLGGPVHFILGWNHVAKFAKFGVNQGQGVV
tara:strand:- start:300 stop:560 length:261 start_codon:yes stop_codon:yes gene_type:complete